MLAELASQGLDAPELFDTFMSRRFERCRMVVENSWRLGEWEKTPDAPDADPVGVMNRSFAALAQPNSIEHAVADQVCREGQRPLGVAASLRA